MTRVRPLLARPGACFACAGDGLCCTDAHSLGPVSRDEAEAVRVIRPDALVRSRELAALVLRTRGGRCVFLGARGCRIHAERGADRKPVGCRRFPFGLVATPSGGRITTEHRCPCRTMGARAPLSIGEAEASLRDSAGRLYADGRIERVRLEPGRSASFVRYETLEAPLLDRIAADVDGALDASALPPLDAMRWPDVATHFQSLLDATALGHAFAWAGDAIAARVKGHRLRAPGRPWARAFDRAEARSPEARPAAILADYVADAVWSLDWAFEATLLHARHELATRVALGRDLATEFERAGARPDRAMAEAVLVIELLGASDAWRWVVSRFRFPTRARRAPRRVGRA